MTADTPTSIIAYRNPLEMWFWESGVVWVVYPALLAVFAIYCVWIFWRAWKMPRRKR